MKNLSVKNKIPIQTNFLGNGAIYHCYAEMPDSGNRTYTSEMADIEADRAGEMRLKIARTMYKWYAWDDENNCWNWETERCKVLYKWLQRMKDRNITVALNTGWCCPGDINNSSWNEKSPFSNNNATWEQSVQNYADWVSETVHQLVEIRGFTNVKMLVMFTEPQNCAGECIDRKAGPVSRNITNSVYDAWKDCVDAADAALKRDGRRNLISIMGPNEGSTTTSEMLKWVAENSDNVDIFSSHTYQFSGDVKAIPGKKYKDNFCSVGIGIPGGRAFQQITLKKNTDYEMKVHINIECEDIMHISGYVVYGAFNISNNTINTGSQPTNRLTLNSTAVIDPAELTEKYEWYSFKFNSENNTEAFIGVYDDIKTPATISAENIQLIDLSNGENIIVNSDFTDGINGWKCFFAGGSCDAYYDWRKWCKTGLQYVPKNKMFIFDEYNVTFNRNNARPEHGANIVLAAISLMNCGVNGSLLWTIFDQIWPNAFTTNNDSFFEGDHRCGTMPVLSRTLTPHLSFYAFSLLSRYTGGENSKVYEGFGEGNVHVTMNEMADGNVTVVVVNNKRAADEFTIEFEKELGLSLNRHRFDPETCVPNDKAEIIPADCTVTAGKTLTDKIGAYSVSIYTTYND